MSAAYENVAAVVVTFFPEGDVYERLKLMASQGAALIVVDNASSQETCVRLEELCLRHGWEFISNRYNLGLGRALNQGVRRLAERGFDWALLFDQDCSPSAGMSQAMISTLQRHPLRELVSVVGANFAESSTGMRHCFLRRHPRWPSFPQKTSTDSVDLLEVSAVITSGSMVRIDDFHTFGGFDEGFFIDQLDTDFCLRCVSKGRLIAVSAAAQFNHVFGARCVRRWLGFTIHPTNHSPVRHYYIARNRIPMWKRHAWRFPHWALLDLATAGLWLFRVVVAETDKWQKIKAMGLGTWDGLLGRKGPCPPKRLVFLSF